MLLGNWPEGHMITSELLDNTDEIQLIGLLDILQRLERKDRFEQVNIYICTVEPRLTVTSLIRSRSRKNAHTFSYKKTPLIQSTASFLNPNLYNRL